MLFVGNKCFAEKEQVKLEEAKFMAKERKCLAYDYDFKFNSGIIHLEKGSSNITLTQER
jgi:hypothetical protein